MYTNETIFQSFHWYTSSDGNFWNFISEKAPYLKELGFTMVWFPPTNKSNEGTNSVGYSVYDLYDIGEFDQKGTVRTKYGTKEEYINCVTILKQNSIKVMNDIVLNHRIGADETEKVFVRDQDSNNRNEVIGDYYEKEIHSKFTFPGRKGKYSEFIWDFQCFSGISDDHEANKFYMIRHEGREGWDQVLGKEYQNYDYLLGADVDFRNPAVREELKKWAEWFYQTAEFDGVRLDAVKHMNIDFINEWVGHLKDFSKKDMMVIAELWSNWNEIREYMEATQYKFQVFDAPLHYNFQKASKDGASYNLRSLLDDTIMKNHSQLCISLVDNHDTQPLQTMSSSIEGWFQPMAHAFILLRAEGIPCVFTPHLFGCEYTDKNTNGEDCDIQITCVERLPEILKSRKNLAYGTQRDYFDHPNTIGWTREGIDERPDSGCAVVIANSQEGYKDMEVGKRHAGKTFTDQLQNRKEEITIDENGWARFTVNGGSVSVWGLKK